MVVSVDTSVRKFHASLNVSDLERSIAFYRVLLGIEPAKVRPDYAKFELSDPPVILSLIPGRKTSSGDHINHVGLRVRNTEELVEVQRRLETAGITTKREEGVECCYAKQTKFWVTDPDRALWEIYVFHEDIDARGDATVPLGEGLTAFAPATPRSVWEHRLGTPIPEKIPHEANCLDEVVLSGSINALSETPNRETLFAEALRALRPGSRIRIHGLAGDRPCPQKTIALPGPAAAVEYVPTAAAISDELARAGFVEIHLETLSETAYFKVEGVSMRELRVEARKPGHRTKEKTHHAIYRGPLAEVSDDFGNVFRRGELTPLNVHDWQMLSASPAADAFLLLAPENSRTTASQLPR
jgi:catechol 2,3-dioxygenase-like lactoylglutathione lyase family enzyme